MENLLRLDSMVLDKAHIDGDGMLRCPAQVTRAGIFTYHMPDGTIRRELRRPEQVFRADSMATLHSKPFVDGHPYELGGSVTAKNAKRIMRGYSGAPAYKDGDNLCVDVFITDEDTIKKAKAGKIALSAGYVVKTIDEPGVWEGQRYDAEQVDIKYNHIALVNVGRAGKEAKLRLDEGLNSITEPEQELPMVKIKLDSGKEIEVSEEVAAAFKQVQGFQTAAIQRADDAEAELLVTKNELSTIKGSMDAMKTRLDALDGEGAKKKEAEAFKAKVKERSSLIATAQGILPKKDHARLDEMDNTEIMQAVIRCDAGDAELKLDSAEAYIKGRFEHVLLQRSKATKGADKGKALGEKINESRADEAGAETETRNDEEGETPEERNERKKKDMTERWKKAPQAGN